MLEDDKAIKDWQKRGDFKTALLTLQRFWVEVLSKHPVFGKMTFSEILDWQAEARGRVDPWIIRRMAQDWINSMEKLRVNSKRSYMSHISSAFLHNNAPFPPDPNFHFDSNTPPVDSDLTIDDFRRILFNCNPRDRAIFMFMAVTLSGSNEMVYINTHEEYPALIWRSLTKNAGIIKLTLPGRKQVLNVKNYFTMFDTRSDAGDALRAYQKSCPVLRRDVLFVNNKNKPISVDNIRKCFHRRAVQAGVVTQVTPPCPRCGGRMLRVRRWREKPTSDPANPVVKVKSLAYICRDCGKKEWASNINWNYRGIRYKVHPHEIRDLMRSRWRASGASVVVAEFIMGHLKQIDPNEYDKMKYTPAYPFQEYRKARPWLDVLTSDPEKVERSEITSELEAYRKKERELTKRVDELEKDARTLESIAEILRNPDKMKKFKDLISK